MCCAAYRIIVKAGWGWLAGFEASGKGLCSRNMSAGALIHCALCVRYLCRHDGLVAKLFGGGKKLSDVGKGLGEGIRNFKDVFKSDETPSKGEAESEKTP